MEWASDPAGRSIARWTPLPGLMAVAVDDRVGDLEGLVVFIRLKERPTEEGVEQSEEEDGSDELEEVLLALDHCHPAVSVVGASWQLVPDR